MESPQGAFSKTTGISASAEMQECAGFELIFPPEHALCRLQALWSGNQPAPLRYTLYYSGQGICMPSALDTAQEAEALRQSLTSAAQAREQAVAGSGERPLPELDEQSFLYLAHNAMAAWLLLFPPTEHGRNLTMLQLLQQLARAGITGGIDLPLVKQLPAPPQRYFQLFPVAKGLAPTRGEDGRIVDRYPRDSKTPVAQGELGQEDYVSLHLVQNIQEGDIICEIVPPTLGTAGYTVTGTPLPAMWGAEAVVPQGRNTARSADGRYLVATRSGHVEFSGHNFQVKPILEIAENVERSSGIINFLGDIHIHGDVCCGATIRALGSIQIDGVVEACTIEAGEHIIVSSGVQGQDRAVLSAQKSVFAKYLEHCSVYAREDVQADCIIDCNIYSNGAVTARTGRGVIIGGTVRAKTQVSAGMVGSKAERPTAIMLGGLPCEEYERTQIQADIEQSEEGIKKCQAQQDTPAKQSELSKLRLNLCVAQMKLEKLEKELHSYPHPRPQADPRRLVCNEAFPGTVVSIDYQSFRFNQAEHNCVIGLANGLVSRMR